MSECDCGCCRTCCGVSDFTQLDSLCGTLAGDLFCAVDDIRDIATQLGTRPYIVSLVWTRWSRGKTGTGVEEVVLVERLLPTPKIPDLEPLDTEVLAIGTEEIGSISVNEISPRYTEDFLKGIVAGNPRLAGNGIEFFWEVQLLKDVGRPGMRRRFTMIDTPSYDTTKLQWSVRLKRAYQNRTQGGIPR